MRANLEALAVALALVTAACTAGTSPGTSPGPVSTDDGSIPVGDGSYQVCWTGGGGGPGGDIRFIDRTEEAGLVGLLTGMRGHAAAWGDVNGDGQVDLFVGTFATARTEIYQQRGADGPSPDRMLIGDGDGFSLLEPFPEQYGRTSGVALVDMDVDADLDLVLSRNISAREADGATTSVLENTGTGFLVAESGIDPAVSGRSVGVLDVDLDGLLDLVILEDRYSGGSSRVYRNLGGLSFEDASNAFGFPSDVHGLGLAVADFNRDGWPDLFVAGSNRLFAGTGSGFTEVPDVIGAWETFGNEDDVSGAAVADVNRDGWLDLLVGHHFNSTVDRDTEVPVRLYLNTTESEGSPPAFRDVTVESGLVAMPTKAPHVELADMDNDGWPDVVTSASAAGGGMPAILRHLGVSDGVPSFAIPEGLGSDQYWVTSPTSDIDRDGRLDLLAVEWDPGLPSILFGNESPGGNWIEVAVGDDYGGVGSRVDVYQAGGAGDEDELIGAREISATVGYTAGVELVAHFGLGELSSIDIVISPPGDGDPATLERVAANQRIATGGGC